MERGCLAKTKDYPGTVYWSVKAGAARGPVISSDRAALLGAASPKCALISPFSICFNGSWASRDQNKVEKYDSSKRKMRGQGLSEAKIWVGPLVEFASGWFCPHGLARLWLIEDLQGWTRVDILSSGVDIGTLGFNPNTWNCLVCWSAGEKIAKVHSSIWPRWDLT